MGWVEDLHGQVVALDTAPLIYYLEEHPVYLPRIDPFFVALARGDLEVVTSTVTLIEVLTLPLRRGDAALAARYRDLLLATEGLTMYAVSPAIAEEAARLRATHDLRTPDAILLATAMIAGATTFLTNDTRLAVVQSPTVLVLDRLPPPHPEPPEQPA